MCLKSPPIFLPLATSTLPPMRIAEISFLRTRGFGSICSLTSLSRWKVPCEWPISTTPRPWLNFFR